MWSIFGIKAHSSVKPKYLKLMKIFVFLKYHSRRPGRIKTVKAQVGEERKVNWREEKYSLQGSEPLSSRRVLKPRD